MTWDAMTVSGDRVNRGAYLRNVDLINCNSCGTGILPVRTGETPAPQVIESTILRMLATLALSHLKRVRVLS
ncbi:MAG: hypothetical protein HC936_12550 [Leptolyngbyaceae cyanobacterium SU_3_3]|nr:hypothetical protein [Leptolyngbyaceae cyanobacterium SU_3_3]